MLAPQAGSRSMGQSEVRTEINHIIFCSERYPSSFPTHQEPFGSLKDRLLAGCQLHEYTFFSSPSNQRFERLVGPPL